MAPGTDAMASILEMPAPDGNARIGDPRPHDRRRVDPDRQAIASSAPPAARPPVTPTTSARRPRATATLMPSTDAEGAGPRR